MVLVTELRRVKGLQPKGLWRVPWVALDVSSSIAFKN